LGLVSDRPEASVPMAERVFQSPIEYMNVNIQESLDSMPVPSHLLFLDHSFRDDCVDRRLGKPSRDSLTGTIPLTVIRHGVGIQF
jgi:hypothetical protein